MRRQLLPGRLEQAQRARAAGGGRARAGPRAVRGRRGGVHVQPLGGVAVGWRSEFMGWNRSLLQADL